MYVYIGMNIYIYIYIYIHIYIYIYALNLQWLLVLPFRCCPAAPPNSRSYDVVVVGRQGRSSLLFSLRERFSLRARAAGEGRSALAACPHRGGVGGRKAPGALEPPRLPLQQCPRS